MTLPQNVAALLDELEGRPRLLLQVPLKPVQGHRFQPTGFPDLGAAVYRAPDGTEMLLVESPQSVANRLEAVAWDAARGDLVPPLTGLPYVRVRLLSKGDKEIGITTSILEAHRLNSPYIMGAREGWAETLRAEAMLPPRKARGSEGEEEGGPGVIDLRAVARAIFRYDPNTLLHGVFLEKLDGRVRLQRTLSGFIEARGVQVAASGGVKFDRVAPSGDTAKGFGNVPFHRTEYVAEAISAYFNLDLAQLRAYGLPPEGYRLLVLLALWKVQRFLEAGLRLRTACDLVTAGEPVVEPRAPLLTGDELEAVLPEAVAACRRWFADPPVTELTYLLG